ncbi:hypothetical protein Tco_0529893 [Tanacetum coccineum]
MYSTSILNMAVLFYFFDDQLTNLSPNSCILLDVLLLLCKRILGIALASVAVIMCYMVIDCDVIRSMALCSIGVVYVVRSMALCSIGGVYVVRSMALCSIGGVLSYAFSDSLLLTPLCCDDIHDVTPRVSALAGCDRLVSEPLVIENSLISLNHGSFDVIVGMDWLSKRKFVIVCHEKIVRIPLEGDEILQVHGERTQGVVKTLVNTKHLWKCKNFESCKIRVSYDLVIFREEHPCRLLRREAWSSFEVSVGITEEGEVVTYLRFIANFSKIVKPLTFLTERNQKYEWGAEREEAF